jgi:hypothetical protein
MGYPKNSRGTCSIAKSVWRQTDVSMLRVDLRLNSADRASYVPLLSTAPFDQVLILARPSRAGRPARRGPTQSRSPVSILARPSPPPMSPNGFQSSPGPRGPGVPHDTPYLRRTQVVSILARPSRAGRPSARSFFARSTEFQSSPGPRGPGVFANTGEENEQTLVSILARPSRAGRPCRSGRCRLEGCFNPRPALAGRASNLPWLRIYEQSVSILARPSRAGRLTAPARAAEQDEFQSSPGPRGPGVDVSGDEYMELCWFQSSPGPRGPGVGERRGALRPLACFNPRPALAGRASIDMLRNRMMVMFQSSPGPRGPGVPRRQRLSGKQAPVSILARPSRAGRRHGGDGHAQFVRFQSSPGPRGPGVSRRACCIRRPTRFNPRPALAGRASVKQSSFRLIRYCFNPRPALAGRASVRALRYESFEENSHIARTAFHRTVARRYEFSAFRTREAKSCSYTRRETAGKLRLLPIRAS